MAKGKNNKPSGGGTNPNRKNGKASKKNPKVPDFGKTGRSIGGYNIEKRPDKVSSWDPIARRKARKSRRKAAGLALAHGIRTGQLGKIKAHADS
jgi:hypothetical protein